MQPLGEHKRLLSKLQKLYWPQTFEWWCMKEINLHLKYTDFFFQENGQKYIFYLFYIRSSIYPVPSFCYKRKKADSKRKLCKYLLSCVSYFSLLTANMHVALCMLAFGVFQVNRNPIISYKSGLHNIEEKNGHCNILFFFYIYIYWDMKILPDDLNSFIWKEWIILEWLRWFCSGVHLHRK